MLKSVGRRLNWTVAIGVCDGERDSRRTLAHPLALAHPHTRAGRRAVTRHDPRSGSG